MVSFERVPGLILPGHLANRPRAQRRVALGFRTERPARLAASHIGRDRLVIRPDAEQRRP